MFLGVNMTFFPMHFLGISGLPRRIPDFPDTYLELNIICSLGSMITIISIIIFLNVILRLLSLQISGYNFINKLKLYYKKILDYNKMLNYNRW